MYLFYKMAKTAYLYLYILCVILAQGIIGTFLENDLGDSSNSLVRQKRVINRLPGKDISVPASTSEHTVNIAFSTNSLHCVGNILSMRTVITAARCVPLDVSQYAVLAGSIYVYANAAFSHNITEKRIHGNHPVQGQRFQTGIALIYVEPSFRRGRNNDVINLHVGPLLANIEGTVRGWGSFYLGGPGETNHPGRLREIKVPIISHRSCMNSFRRFFEITDEYFCTYDARQQCGYTDAGAGFVIENSLAGIYIGHIQTGDDSHLKPDVFIMLQHSNYHQWILRNLEN